MTAGTPALDLIDRRIVDALLRDARLTWQALADEIGLSPSATTDRVRRLEARGVLAGYGARVPAAVIGRPLEAWVAVVLAEPADGSDFEAAIRGEPAIVEAVHLTGSADYEVRALCADTAEVDALVRRLKSEHGAARTETRIVLDRPYGPALLPPPS
ncbi:Lrp/AsnC family transcriptional regulator [Nitriliruptor alkaliphilus]|uniref:Lrp/AsnC family transcriptional regulator n=1 Tax=Nitriliruptor alkaliphilus TaxID=427918 RepID=UPI0009FA0A58|nr:Lrp/AsnC family transcriptional regulator [Nitriliruptor alkaliphilus]